MVRGILIAFALAAAVAAGAPAHAGAPAPDAAGARLAPRPGGAPHESASAQAIPAAAAPDSAAAAADRAARPALAPTPAARPPGRDHLAEARALFTDENRAYSGARVVVRLVGPLYGILCGLLVLFTGLSARYRDVAEGLGHRRYVQVLVFFALYAGTMFVLGLPFAWYEEFALEHQYGLSTQSFGGWLLDSLKGLVTSVVAVGVLPLLALAWRAVESSPRRWWLWLAAGTLPVALAATLLEPVVVDPLFNKFTPLRDSSLSRQILDMAREAGIPARHVYQVDMSNRTRKLNAYVNGFGASQRVVLWDTTLRRMTRREVLFVTAHEMGHYVLGHEWQWIVLISVGAFVAFGLCAWFAGMLLAAFGAGWGVRGHGDLASLPVLALSLTLATLVLMPASNAASRRAEHEADVFGLEMTRDNDAAASAFLKLAEDNRSDPEPPLLVELLLYDHPTLSERIRFATGYRPWEHGAPNRFFPARVAARRMNGAPLVWLFDVDGTLLLTEGAGRLAIAAALRERFGVDDDLAHVPMAGRTDPLIVADALRAHGLALDGEGERVAFWDAVFANMRRLMVPPRGGLLPGAREAVERAGDTPGWTTALLTGNVHEMARIKLGAFGLWDRFAFGAFGDEAPDRDALAQVAVSRAADRCGVPAARCVVVGDTEHDIACARAAGARVVAVATGGRPRALLARHEPDLLLDDLRESEAMFEWAEGL